ncbi:hypothetical protein GCM10011392_36990 [Wenxinia marina]|nr:hypothetical protein GCM10011392_36990 [Wenxinia marina]
MALAVASQAATGSVARRGLFLLFRCRGRAGFLLGLEPAGPAGPLPPLPTRDCLLPIVAPLAAARAAGRPRRGSARYLDPRGPRART